jgi:FkbM family methyltransferase
MKVLFLAPHLSTGGMPQYLYKQMEVLSESCEVWCIEWDNITGGVLVVQRNRVANLLGDKLITLGEPKEKLFEYIEKINPDVIHLQEIPEMFMSYDLAVKLYNPNRKYKIVETSHDSSFDISNKKHFPDHFAMVSQYQIEAYKSLDIPCELVEYPIEYKTRTKSREELLAELGLDPNKKHVINVGLFTSRKNQAEVVEYARQMQDYPIQFHFIGNQADNFKYYWEPIMKDFPSNCKWWGERSDVDTFYQMADLFLFTSRGHINDKETMPLVIREAISWKVPSLIYNLDVYLNYFNKYDNIEYLDFNNKLKNIEKILTKLNITGNQVNNYFDIQYEGASNKFAITYKKNEPAKYKISIKDKDSNAPIYWFSTEFNNEGDHWWIIPTPLHIYNFAQNPDFGSFLVEFYDENNNFLFDKTIFLKEIKKQKLKLNLKSPFDCLFTNYNEMFIDNKYDCYELDKMETVFDIGANCGLFSLLAIEKGAKKVYAFEPNQESLVNLNQIAKGLNIEVIDKAVYTTDEDLTFYIDPNNTTIGSISEDHIINGGSKVEKITVPAISLKTFIEQNNIEKISLLKMDIEGAEYDIIENLEDEVFEKIDNFLIEYHDNEGEKVEKLIQTLVKKGFDIDQIRNQNSKNNDDILESYKSSPLGTIFAKKSPEEKLLTVIIPTYNHEKYIEQCVDSALMQKTLFNFNILISDDRSTDNTWNIVQKYKDIPNVIVKQNEVNLGPTPKRLHAVLKESKSEYITLLDGDDYYVDENKLQKQVNFLKNNKEYSIYSVGYYQKELDDSNFMNINYYGVKEEVILRDNMEANYVSFGFMFRNSLIRDMEFPDWYFHEDLFDGYWALNNILLEKGKGRNDKWVGGVYRITPNGAFGEKSKEWKDEVSEKQSRIIKSAFPNVNKDFLVNESNLNLQDVYDKHFSVQYKEVPYLKSPMDYVLHQMIIMSLKPDLIIEIGTYRGGGALYYADLLYLLGKGEVHTINVGNEIVDQKVFNHGQIRFFYDGFENYDLNLTKGFEKILVIDDASHSYVDTLRSLNKFSKVVSKDSYFIVEKGVVDFVKTSVNYNGGPRRAIDEFLQTNSNFVIDRNWCDYFGTNATFNSDGYLKRIN